VEQDKSLKEMEKHEKDVQGKTIELRGKISKLVKIGFLQYFFSMILSLITFIIAATIIGLSIYMPKQELPKQINEVENAIQNLRNLENYLEKTKSNMIATEEAKIKIEEEYEKAKELEKLTDKQIEAISLAVNKITTDDIIKNYFWGFVLGVSGSLFASYIYGYLKRKKEKISIVNKVEQSDV